MQVGRTINSTAQSLDSPPAPADQQQRVICADHRGKAERENSNNKRMREEKKFRLQWPVFTTRPARASTGHAIPPPVWQRRRRLGGQDLRKVKLNSLAGLGPSRAHTGINRPATTTGRALANTGEIGGYGGRLERDTQKKSFAGVAHEQKESIFKC